MTTRKPKKVAEPEVLEKEVKTLFDDSSASAEIANESAQKHLPAPRKKATKGTETESAKVATEVAAAAPPAPDSVLMIREIFERIERIACSNIMPENLEKILAMQERIMDRQSRLAFNEAFVIMAPELPIITKDGRIEAKGVSRTSGKEYEQSTPYAKWEAISPIVVPILAKHGFSLRHKTETAPDGKIRITALLYGHGHTETSYLDFELDTTGSKNNAQARVSATSYGRRITGSTVLNLVTKGEDDDGKATGKPKIVGEPLTEEEIETLVEAAEADECPREKLVDHLNKQRPRNHPAMETLKDLPRGRFDEALNAIRSYGANLRDSRAKPKEKANG